VEGARLSRYAETVVGDEDACLVLESGGREPAGRYPVPSLIHLGLDRETHFRVEGGILRMLNGLHHESADRHPPFASLALMNRYASREARLEVRGLESWDGAFASATDLGTGLERPLGLDKGPDGIVVSYPDCPPRTLLRAYWPLRRDA
jgi:hypothetical protein